MYENVKRKRLTTF